MHSLVRPWQVLFLALLLIWAGISYAHHTEPGDADSHDSATLIKKAGEHDGKLHKACHTCCHGAHVETNCIETFKPVHLSGESVTLGLLAALPSPLLPPPTPPPQR